MIRELGQTPSQLLTAPHPQRYPRGDSRVTSSPIADAVLLGNLAKGWAVNKAYFVETVADDPIALIAVQPPPEASMAEWMRSGLAASLFTVSERGVVGVNNWLPDRGSKGRLGPWGVEWPHRSPSLVRRPPVHARGGPCACT